MSNTIKKEDVSSSFEIGVSGPIALFCNPMFKTGGEKFSYPVPTYGALKGLVESIYWKPTFIVVIDSVRIINEIKYTHKTLTISKFHEAFNKTRGTLNKELFTYTYLSDVHYQIRFHMKWNNYQSELVEDRNWGKHNAIMNRQINRGGKCNPFLGASECYADIFKEEFESRKGYYDESGKVNFGIMFHSYLWGTEYDENDVNRRKLRKAFWTAEMINGVITFPQAEDCIVEDVRTLESHEQTVYPNSKVS